MNFMTKWTNDWIFSKPLTFHALFSSQGIMGAGCLGDFQNLTIFSYLR